MLCNCNCTIDSQVELSCGLSSDVAGHTCILSFVAELSHVDLQVASTRQNTHTGRGLQKQKKGICDYFLAELIE